MSDTVISVENLSKSYQLGVIGTGTFYGDLKRWWARQRGKPDPYLKIGETDHGNRNGETIWALRDVNFNVQRGEALGIIGRNGAGKSTLLKILSQVTAPTFGVVRVKGRIASLLEVGTGFHPELTGRENIYLNGAILGMTRAEVKRKFDEIVDFSGVERFIDTPVKRYSSGMYVRLAFAVAAHLDPEILVVDEVLAVGDAEFQKKCLGKMGEVAHEGRTVLFVSHSMNAIESLCNACVFIERGRIRDYSTDVSRIIKEYLFPEHKETSICVWRNLNNFYANPYFQPHSFSLVTAEGQHVAGAINNMDEVYIQIDATIKLYDPALTMGYAIYDEDSNLLYWSYQTDQSEAQWPRLGVGRWILSSKLPQRILNEGTYRLELIGGLHFRQWLFEPGHDVPSLSFTIQGGLSDSPFWLNKRPGIMAPVMTWRTYEVH